MLSGKLPDCKKCGYELVIPENFEVMTLIEDYLDLIILPGFGISLPNIIAIYKIFEIEEIPEEDRLLLLYRIMIYISTANNAVSTEFTYGSGKTKTVSKKGSRESVTYRG